MEKTYAKHEWIPCKIDRPEFLKPVLVPVWYDADSGYHVSTGYLLEVRTVETENGVKKFYEFKVPEFEVYSDFWMPLPEPPKP